MKTLNELNVGESAVVSELFCTGALKRRFLDIGLIRGTNIKCVARSPQGDPKAFLIRGAVIALRNKDSARVSIGNENG